MAKFPLEKILNISAQEYVGPYADVRNDYELVGVHYSGTFEVRDSYCTKNIATIKFAGEVPENAEVVVGYICTPCFGGENEKISIEKIAIEAHGTALIQRDGCRKG